MIERALREFELIAEILSPLAAHPGAFGLADDVAVIDPPPGRLVVTADAVTEGVHFLPGDPPETVGHKALAVNLSDLAAKAATPIAYLMTLSLPGMPERAWLQRFAEGLRALQDETGITLLGGDTNSTPGPLSISITALGIAGERGIIPRAGGSAGDILFVTGTIGDGTLGLAICRDAAQAARWSLDDRAAHYLMDRYRRPRARLSAEGALRHYGTATIDISDGLVGDLDKLCAASDLGAVIEAERIPLSTPAHQACRANPELLTQLFTGGDDYELLIATRPETAQAFENALKAASTPVTPIGRLQSAEQGVAFLNREGAPLAFSRRSFDHFSR